MPLFISKGEIEEDSVAWDVLNVQDGSFANVIASLIAAAYDYAIETDALVWFNCDAFWSDLLVV